ncbi:hypothetical protein I2494_17910 [Budviciaceae bacterium BWR-B9]|uniref:Lipoprotein n=1 Tax=Limnobaculum allomyrinae TaxID=2791986 RepID=A0ABS1IUZ3_9GAMM|nr:MULTISPECIES: hypothetical protein [Limnobaculum]MBK5145558.1 hypothetical protein [Limnobaculum allomyrinae]MBV7693676.1 hypothetical protein [Limnobaculum sp. M2-1]
MKILFLMISTLLLSSCITGHVTEEEMLEYKGKNIQVFMSEQYLWNYRKSHNSQKVINDRVFFDDSAIFIEEQVSAVSENIKRLCRINGGASKITPLSGDIRLDLRKTHQLLNNLNISLIFKEYDMFKDVSIELKKEGAKNNFYFNKLQEYIEKEYFFDNFICQLDGKRSWSVSVYPMPPREDKSQIDSIFIFVIVNEI